MFQSIKDGKHGTAVWDVLSVEVIVSNIIIQLSPQFTLLTIRLLSKYMFLVRPKISIRVFDKILYNEIKISDVCHK